MAENSPRNGVRGAHIPGEEIQGVGGIVVKTSPTFGFLLRQVDPFGRSTTGPYASANTCVNLPIVPASRRRLTSLKAPTKRLW